VHTSSLGSMFVWQVPLSIGFKDFPQLQRQWRLDSVIRSSQGLAELTVPPWSAIKLDTDPSRLSAAEITKVRANQGGQDKCWSCVGHLSNSHECQARILAWVPGQRSEPGDEQVGQLRISQKEVAIGPRSDTIPIFVFRPLKQEVEKHVHKSSPHWLESLHGHQ
jgi:hypothetical protein